MSFTINDVTFIESCQFMLSNLDKLSSKDQFRETRKYLESFYVQQPNRPQTNNMAEGGEGGEAMDVHEDYRNHPYQPPTPTPNQQQQTEEDLALMTRNRVYPYQYMDSFERFQETQLPPKDSFYSSLTEEDISEIDFIHSQRVFNRFNMTDLGHCHNLYLLTDVLLLANVFENFRDMCLQHYCLDPSHNYTSPGLSWQAALKMTDVELNLFTDIDQHLFIEEGFTGGVMTPAKLNSYILYLDANNLYGWGSDNLYHV